MCSSVPNQNYWKMYFVNLGAKNWNKKGVLDIKSNKRNNLNCHQPFVTNIFTEIACHQLLKNFILATLCSHMKEEALINASKIRRHGLYGRLVWRFGIVIFMFMLVGIGYRLRSWFKRVLQKNSKVHNLWSIRYVKTIFENHWGISNMTWWHNLLEYL